MLSRTRKMRKHRVVLEHHRQSARTRRQTGDVAAADQHAPAGLLFQAGKGAQQRGLAAAGRSKQRDELAVAHIQRDVAQRGLRAEGLVDGFDADVGHQSVPLIGW